MNAIVDFYTMADPVRVVITMFAIITAILAALVFTLRRYRYDRALYYWLDSGFCFLVLIQALTCTFLLAQVQFNLAEGLAPQSGYRFVRYAIFSAIAVVFVCHLVVSFQLSVFSGRGGRGVTAGSEAAMTKQVLYRKTTFLPLVQLVASFLTLPIMETWAGSLFPVCFSATLLILFISNVLLFVLTRNELRSTLSGLSVMQAMDSLNTAVMYYKKNGHILLQNERMRELMIRSTGRVHYNGKQFFEAIVKPNSEKAGDSGDTSGNFIYRLPDVVWLFSVKEFLFAKSAITQVFATDVTEQDHINQVLQENQQRLIRRQEKLRELVNNIEDIRRSEELLRLRAALHDEQNQKLTLLLRYLRTQGTDEDSSLGGALGDDPIAFFREGTHWDNSLVFTDEHAKAAPMRAELEALVSVYGQAGVNIMLFGDLPEDVDTTSALVHILREAAANAVIHGYANEIYAAIVDSGNEIAMCITDNSALVPKGVREGTGISEMRRRLAAIGGELIIDVEDGFTLSVIVQTGSDQGAGVKSEELGIRND